jgi:PAS domain S-box-containing protein
MPFLPQKRILTYLIPLVVLVVLGITNVVFFQFLGQLIYKKNYDNFVHNATVLTEDIVRELNSYELVLRGARGLFNAAEAVDRKRWQNYVESLNIEQGYEGIQAISFSKFVKNDELAAHVEEIRAEGFPRYRVWPDGERASYAPAMFVEPFKNRNVRVFGYDMLSDETRRSAIELAQFKDRAVLSGKVRLVQEMDVNTQNGFLIFLPVYKSGMLHQTMEEKKKALYGIVHISFRAHDFMESALHGQFNHIKVEIYDGSTQDSQQLIAEHSIQMEESSNDKWESYVTTISVLEKKWTIKFSVLRSVLFQEGANTILALKIMAVVISLLVWMVIFILMNTRGTSLKMAEDMTENLTKSEAQFKAMSEASPLGIFMTDKLGNCVYTNYNFQRMSGLSEHEAVGKGWIESIYPDDRHYIVSQWQGFVDGRLDHYKCKHRFLRKNGTVVWVKVQAAAVKNGEALLGYLGVIEDINEFMLQEGALQESEERARLIIDTALDAVVILDADERIIGWNKQAEIIFGYDYEDVQRHLFSEMVSPAFRTTFLETFKKFSQSGEAEHINSRMSLEALHRDGKIFPIELSISPFYVRKNIHFSLFIRDIASFKELEDIASERTKIMEKMNKLMIDRELKMVELKEEIKKLNEELSKHQA